MNDGMALEAADAFLGHDRADDPVASSIDLTVQLPLERAARAIEDSGRYRVLRRIPERPVAPDMPAARTDGRTCIGIVLDTETTGLDATTDTVVELAMVAFTYADGRILDVIGVWEGWQEPPVPLTADVRKLTGLTDEELSGKSLDIGSVEAFVGRADLVVAHNAVFDRAFCERLSPVFATKRWACSATEVPWRAMGTDSAKLGHLLAYFGFFHDAHRALADCRALLEILAAKPVDGPPAFAHLAEAAASRTVEISAEKAPFMTKDLLKSRGYRWSNGEDGRPKAWRKSVGEDAFESEMAFLKMHVYPAGQGPTVRHLDAVQRHRIEKASK